MDVGAAARWARSFFFGVAGEGIPTRLASQDDHAVRFVTIHDVKVPGASARVVLCQSFASSGAT